MFSELWIFASQERILKFGSRFCKLHEGITLYLSIIITTLLKHHYHEFGIQPILSTKYSILILWTTSYKYIGLFWNLDRIVS